MSAGLEFETRERIQNVVEEVTQGPLSSLSIQNQDTDAESSSTLNVPELTEEVVNRSLSSDDEGEDEFQDARDKISPSNESVDNMPTGCIEQDKHIFVLSEAGKPIYILHGDDDNDQMVAMCGVMQALVSYVADCDDSIRSIRTPEMTIVFLSRPPLLLVGSCRNHLTSQQLSVQLTYIYNQILSVVTLSQLTKIFDQKRNYDLRKMLGGSERLIDHLSTSMDTDPSFFLSAVRCLPLAPSVRDVVSESIIKYCSKKKNVVFSVVMARNQLITLVRMKNYFIHPADLHLLFNLVNATENFRNSETWTPICLPKFESSGFLHAHVSYISNDICLVLISVDRNSFFELSEARLKIKERLERHNTIQCIDNGLENAEYDCQSLDLPEIRYFVYKSRTSAQYTSPSPGLCYRTPDQLLRLHSIFLSIQNRFLVASRPVKLSYFATSNEIILGWITNSFELFAVLPPTSTKMTVLTAVNKLLRWVKKEEEKLFILTAPTF